MPPRVRQGLLSRTLDYDGLLAELSTPVLITHGLEDEVVLPAMADHNASLIPHAQTSYYANVGHATCKCPSGGVSHDFVVDLGNFVQG